MPGWTARLGLATVLYVTLTALVFRRFLPDLDHLLLGPPEDNLQDLWNTWYSATHIHSLADILHTNMIKFPEGTQLYYHSFAYPKTLMVALFGPLIPASPGALLTLQNLLLLVSFPLSALGAFCLVRHYTREDFGALVGGAVFGFNPSHVEQSLHHLHVSSIEFIPFFVLFFILADERRSIILLSFSVLSYVLCALSCWYYMFYCSYFMVFYYTFHAWRRRVWLGAREVAVIGAHLAGLGVIASPLLVPMIAAAASGADVYADASGGWVADLAGYVTFPPLHPLGWLTGDINRKLTGNEWESTVYLGIVNLALLAWLFTRRRPEARALRPFLISGMLVFAAFASGDWLQALGQRLLPMPDMLLEQLPFFRNVRTASRAIVFVYLFLAIGVGVAITTLRVAGRGPWHGPLVAAGLVMLIAIDWYPVRVPTTPFACSPAYRIVAADADPAAAVFDLPLDYADNNAAMAYQICHGHPIAGGVVSRELGKTLRDRLINNDMQAQRNELAESGVKYLVIHRPDGHLFNWPAGLGAVEDYVSTYTVLYSGPDAILLRVD